MEPIVPDVEGAGLIANVTTELLALVPLIKRLRVGSAGAILIVSRVGRGGDTEIGERMHRG
jgi:hypothetical protein